MRLLTLAATFWLCVVSIAEGPPPLLKVYMQKINKGQIVTSAEWPEYFDCTRKLIPGKVSDLKSHLASLKLVPQSLIKDYKFGATVEHDGFYFTDVLPSDMTLMEPVWMLAVASKKGESYLYLYNVALQGFVWAAAGIATPAG